MRNRRGRRKVWSLSMLMDECYRLLDLDRGAGDEEVRSAHRDLMKVWHPDRFGNDPDLRLKAEEKLKAINEAYETIRAAREHGIGSGSSPRAPHSIEPFWLPRFWAMMIALTGLIFLFRRPSPAGFLLAVVFFGVALILLRRGARRR